MVDSAASSSHNTDMDSKEIHMGPWLMKPTEEEVEQVMQDLRIDRLQAYRHAQQRIFIQKTMLPAQSRFPLGKSAYYE